jgi:hypothetical protein
MSLIVELEKFEKTWKKQRIGLDKPNNLVYNTDMKNKDTELAKTYWNNADKGVHNQMIKSMKEAAIKGRMFTFATLENKDKLSCYRELGRKLGYKCGEWKLDKINLIAIMTVTK